MIPALASLSETADRARVVARLRIANAEWFVSDVRSRFGSMSIEYMNATNVLSAEHARLLRTYSDGLVEASGVPVERTS